MIDHARASNANPENSMSKVRDEKRRTPKLTIVKPKSDFNAPRSPRALADFKDLHGRRVILYRSAAVEENSVWIFATPDPELVDYTSCSPYLGVEQARALVRGLQRFIDSSTRPQRARRRRR